MHCASAETLLGKLEVSGRDTRRKCISPGKKSGLCVASYEDDTRLVVMDNVYRLFRRLIRERCPCAKRPIKYSLPQNQLAVGGGLHSVEASHVPKVTRQTKKSTLASGACRPHHVETPSKCGREQSRSWPSGSRRRTVPYQGSTRGGHRRWGRG